MSCKIPVSNLRSTLRETISELREQDMEANPDGSTSAFSLAWYQNLLGEGRTADDLSKMLKLRIEELSQPFHQILQRNLGDTLRLEKNGKMETYYLHSSYLTEEASNSPRLNLVVAPANNIAKKETLTFAVNNDTALGSQDNSVQIYGLGDIFEQSVAAHLKQKQSQAVKEVVIDDGGHAPLEATLKAMDHANKMLGVRQSRLGPQSIVGYEHIRDYKHGDIASMKEMLNKINVLSGRKASETEMEFLNGLFDSFHPHFFNELQLYLKKNGAENLGQVDLDNKRIQIQYTKDATERTSGAEVYAHEVIHTMVAWALRQPHKSVTAAINQLNHAMDVAFKNTRWQDLLPVAESEATALDIQRAKDQFDYIFTSENAQEEFLAHALTNPQFRKHLQSLDLVEKTKKKTNILSKLVELFQKIVNVAVGNFSFKDGDVSVYEKVHELAFSLAEINNTHREELKQSNPLGVVIGLLENTESFLSKQLSRAKEFVSNKDSTVKVPEEGAGVVANALFFLDFSRKALTNPVYRKFMGLLASAYGLKTNSVIREFARGFFERSPEFLTAEKLNLLSTEMDASRNAVINATAKELKNSFKKPLEKKESEALTTAFVQTNASSLLYDNANRKKYEDKDFRELLKNKFAREKRIRQLEKDIRKEIGEGSRANWTIAQGKELGRFMVTGQGSVALNLNPVNIAKGFGTNERYTPTAKLVAAIEDLATVTALASTRKKELGRVLAVFESEPKGVKAIADAMMAYRANSLEHTFGKDPTHMILGHTKELFDSTIDVKIAPVSEASKLREQGYELQNTLKNANGVAYRTPMGLYVTNTWGKAERLKGAVALGVNKAKGTTLRQLKSAEYGDSTRMATAAFGRDFARVMAQSYALNEAMGQEGFTWDDTAMGLSPVYSKTGQITDFRFMMPKDQKAVMMKQDLDVFEVVSRTAGDVLYQVGQTELNDQALQLVKNDMLENWDTGTLGKNQIEYLEIGPDVIGDRGKELFYLLPENMKDFILSRTDKKMAVREEIVEVLFGYQHLQMSNFPGIKMLPKVVRSIFDMAEGLWIEMVKIAKGVILLKMPIVLYSNLISNVMYAISTGSVNPVELLRDYRDGFREVNDYIKANTRIAELEAQLTMGRAAGSRVRGKENLESKMKHVTAEIDMLKARQAKNPLHSLFQAGMYQSYIQDVGANTLSESNRLSELVSKRVEKLPKAVKYTAEVAYLTQNTQWYKISQEILQRSDMISRAAEMKRERRRADKQMNGQLNLPDWWVNAQKEKLGDYPARKTLTPREREEFREKFEEVLFQAVKDNYINYTLPNTAFEEWANRVGLLMFTKYLKRVQPIIRNSFMQHPLKTATMLLVGSTVAQSMSTIQDSNLLLRSFDYSGDFNPLGVVPIYNPLRTLELVLMPPIIKSDTYMNLLW